MSSKVGAGDAPHGGDLDARPPYWPQPAPEADVRQPSAIERKGDDCPGCMIWRRGLLLTLAALGVMWWLGG